MNHHLKKNFKSLLFDVEEPHFGHFNRFEKKVTASKKRKKYHSAYKYIAFAASFLLLISIAFQITTHKKGIELSDLSPKMKKTESYFTETIQKELKIIHLQGDKSTQKLILNAQKELKKLELEYQKLSIDLSKNSYSKRIINAMIYNYQQRINILKNVILEIETIKKLNTNHYETYS